jgi:hypothetical protein
LAKALQETGSGTIVEFEDKEATRKEIDRLYGKFLEEKEAGKNGAPDGGNAQQAGNHREEKILSPAVMKYSRKHLTGEMVKLFGK